MNIGFSGALPLFALKPNIGTDIKFATRAVTISTIYIAIIGIDTKVVLLKQWLLLFTSWNINIYLYYYLYIGITRLDVKVALLLHSYK